MLTLVTTRQSSNKFGSVLAAPRVLRFLIAEILIDFEQIFLRF